MNLEGAYRLDPQVALRPEPFGALAYHYGNRRLVFLRSPDMVRVVEALADQPTVADALAGGGHRPEALAVVRVRPDRSRILRGDPCSLTT